MENLKESDWELIEKYLRGTASESERQEIEKRQTDEEFQAAVKVQQDVLAAIEIAGDRELKARLQRKEAELAGYPKKSKVRPLRRRWLGIMAVAAAVLLVITFVGIQFLGSGTTQEDLFAAYFEPYEAVAETTISRGNSETPYARAAYTAFLQGDYASAINQFEAYLNEQEDAVVEFHLAQALLAEKRATEALPILQQLDVQADFPLAAQTDWYLALALLETGDTEAARQQLKTITNQAPTTYKHTAAQTLLNTL